MKNIPDLEVIKNRLKLRFGGEGITVYHTKFTFENTVIPKKIKIKGDTAKHPMGDRIQLLVDKNPVVTLDIVDPYAPELLRAAVKEPFGMEGSNPRAELAVMQVLQGKKAA